MLFAYAYRQCVCIDCLTDILLFGAFACIAVVRFDDDDVGLDEYIGYCAFYHPRSLAYSEGAIVFSNACLWLTLSVNATTPKPLEISSRNFQGIILCSKGRRPSSKNGYIGMRGW